MVIETFMAMNVSDLCQHGTAGSKTSISTSGPVNCRNSLQCPAVVGVFDPVRDAITDSDMRMGYTKHSIMWRSAFGLRNPLSDFLPAFPQLPWPNHQLTNQQLQAEGAKTTGDHHLEQR